MGRGPFKSKPGEQSFTLIETVIALGLMVTVVLEVSKVQGNAIYFAGYERKVTQAIWVAKGIMSKVEYWWAHTPFEEMDISPSESEYKDLDGDYTYSVEIAEWKLPLMDLITGGLGGGGGGGGEQGGGGGVGDMIRGQVEQILGDEILKIARVQVFWPEGAKKESVSLTLLLTNQKKLDQVISTLPPLKSSGGKKAGGSGGKRGSRGSRSGKGAGQPPGGGENPGTPGK